MRLTNWHCTDEECAERFFRAQKKCCMIAFAIFVVLFACIFFFTGEDVAMDPNTATPIDGTKTSLLSVLGI